MKTQTGNGSAKVCRGPVCAALCKAGHRQAKDGGLEWDFTAFGPSINNKDGRNGKCRMCTAYDFRKRDAARRGIEAPDPAAYAETYRQGKGARRAAKKEPPKPIDTFAEAAPASDKRACAAPPCTIVLDLSARPDIYQKLAQREALSIIISALEGN